MTGGGRQKTVRPIEPDPSPTPIIAEEVAGAKGKVKRRAARIGRGRNILAGRMMQSRQILNTGQLKLGA